MLKLSKRVPARTVTFEATACLLNYSTMGEAWRRGRSGLRNPMNTCHWCRHVFADGESIALALTAKGSNKVLCQTCGKKLIDSKETS